MPQPPHSDSLLDTIARRLARWRGTRLVVAVSGGGDSVAMLRLLHELTPTLHLSLVVAHLNHGVRGDEADAEAAFVAHLAESLGLPCEIGQWRPERPAHFEDDARRARYAWLAEIATRHNAPAVAVGHTREDQVETILQRILRGTGLRGLAGMPASRSLAPGVQLIRPLLNHSRESLRDYLCALQQPHYEDPTNTEPMYTRARLRQELIPLLQSQYNPRVVEAILRLGALAQASDAALRPRLRSAARPIATPSENEVVLNVTRLAALPPVLRAEALRVVWRRLGWPQRDMTRTHWRRLAQAASSRHRQPARFQLPGPIEVERRDDRLTLRRPQPRPDPPPKWQPLLLPIPGQAQGPFGTIAISADRIEPATEIIDAEALEPFHDANGFPYLLLRPPHSGDRFAPLGMGGRSRPLRDFLRERRMPRARRGVVPLLCDARGILWVVGHRIADRVKRHEGTQARLGMRFEPPA